MLLGGEEHRLLTKAQLLEHASHDGGLGLAHGQRIDELDLVVGDA